MILGLARIAPTVFWGPMAYAIMGGLAVATVLTLISLPSALHHLVQNPARRRADHSDRRVDASSTHGNAV